MARKSEMMDAIEALAKAKDISVDQIMEAVEDGLKAAYRRYMKRSANAPQYATASTAVSTARPTARVARNFAHASPVLVIRRYYTKFPPPRRADGQFVPSRAADAQNLRDWPSFASFARIFGRVLPASTRSARGSSTYVCTTRRSGRAPSAGS